VEIKGYSGITKVKHCFIVAIFLSCGEMTAGILERSIERGKELQLTWEEYVSAFGPATWSEEDADHSIEAIESGSDVGKGENAISETILIDVDRAKYLLDP